MKFRLIILIFSFLFINLAVGAVSRFSDDDFILMQKSKTPKDQNKKPDENDSENSEKNKDTNKEKLKDSLKKNKEKRMGGRFGDKRF